MDRYRWAVWLRLGLIAVLALGCGCYKQKIVFRVKPDGSGYIVLARVYGRGVVQRHEAIRKARAEGMDPFGEETTVSTNNPFFNLNAIRAEAGYFGPGVKLLKAREYERTGGHGFTAVYAFEDIGKVYLNFRDAWGHADSLVDEMPGEDGPQPVLDIVPKTENAISFTMKKGVTNTLTVHLPKFSEPLKAEEEADTEEEEEDPDDFVSYSRSSSGLPRSMQRLLGRSSLSRAISGYGYQGTSIPTDLSVDLSIEVVGDVTHTTALHPAPGATNRWSLVTLDASSLTADKKNARRIQRLPQGYNDDPMEFVEGLLTLPGAVCERAREVHISFK